MKPTEILVEERARTRSGTVILLRADASRDTAYTLASDILEPFLEALEEGSRRDIEFRTMAEKYILKLRAQ